MPQELKPHYTRISVVLYTEVIRRCNKTSGFVLCKGRVDSNKFGYAIFDLQKDIIEDQRKSKSLEERLKCLPPLRLYPTLDYRMYLKERIMDFS